MREIKRVLNVNREKNEVDECGCARGREEE